MTDYIREWRSYRRRFRTTFAVWVLPAAAIYLSGVGGPLQIWLIAAWLLAFTVSMIWLFSFRCPRCREWYFIKLPTNHPLTRVCVHCGLPKWARSDPREGKAEALGEPGGAG